MTGRRLAHYEIRGLLGSGGMGIVYEAHDILLDRCAALKVLPPHRAQDPARRRRLLREARAASALNHPSIVTVYEVGTEDQADFIAMELVRGETLAARLRTGPIPVDEAVRYAIQVADALDCAHAAGLVHRDLKPGNIMITPAGLVKLLDFGLAKRYAEDGVSLSTAPLTEEGAVLGTLAYMAPEQARGEDASPASDIFSFGVVLYEMLAGERPFRGNSQVELFHQILYSPASALRGRGEIPGSLADLVMNALAKKPEDRLKSMGAAAAVLRTVTDELHRSGKVGRGGRRIVAAAALAALAGAGWWWLTPLTGAWTNRFRSAATTWTLPTSASEQIAQGRAFFDRRDRKGYLDKAVASFDAAIRQDPQNATAYAGLADCQVAMHIESPDAMLIKQADRNAATALRLNDRLAVSHSTRGWYLARLGRPDDAVAAFDRALQLDPTNAQIHLRAAQALLRMRRFDEAEQHINKALQLTPEHWEPYSYRGTFFAQRGRYQEAAEAFRKGCALAPDHYVLQRNLGGVEFHLGRYEEARAAFQRSLEARPTSTVFSNLGTYYYYTQQYSEAADAFQKALEIDANDYRIWGNLGDAYRVSAGTRARAAEAHRQALRLAREMLVRAPADLALRCQMAALLAKTGDLDGARSALRELEHEKLAEPDLLFNKAVAFEITGDRDGALASLRAAVAEGLPVARMQNEPEFLGLRRTPGYHALTLNATARPNSSR